MQVVFRYICKPSLCYVSIIYILICYESSTFILVNFLVGYLQSNIYHFKIVYLDDLVIMGLMPNLTLRTMQLNVWVIDNFMNIKMLFLPLILSCYNPKMSKNHTPLCLLLCCCTAEYLVNKMKYMGG